MAFNITAGEVPEAVISESDEQAHICLYRCKGELRTLETYHIVCIMCIYGIFSARYQEYTHLQQ